MKQSAYEILHIEPGANAKSIRRAYKELIRVYGPEQNPEKFSEIREAFEHLSRTENFRPDSNFPYYHNILTDIEKDPSMATAEKEFDPVEVYQLLTNIFETPYNTAYEIKSLLKND